VKADYLVLSCSLSAQSRSRVLALAVYDSLRKRVGEGSAEYLDARDMQLPFCDGGEAFSHPHVSPLQEKIAAARCVILGVPIYNYSTSGLAKNLIELTGDAWNGKIVGFLCAAGGHRSYMSAMSLANSLMLDFECIIIPRYVYGSGEDFSGDTIKDPDVKERVENLAKTAIRFSEAWRASENL
jgi:NAD(P)H-dependent FMN reductase